MVNTGTVLVTGATGNVGSRLVPALRATGASVRALVHNESKVQAIKDLGVEVFVGDLDKPETLDPAVAGVGQVYLLTTNGPTGAQQASNVIQAARRNGSPHIVRHSAYGPEKSRIIKHVLQVEAELKASGLSYTILRPTFFMQNTMMAAQTVASDGVVYMPFKDGKIGMIDVRDVADVALKVLTEDGHEGREYTLTGPASISFHDVAAGLSKALGKEVNYVDVPLEAGREAMVGMGMPEWVADGLIELIEGFSNNWADLVSPDVEKIMGRPGRSYEQFARDFAQVFGGS